MEWFAFWVILSMDGNSVHMHKVEKSFSDQVICRDMGEYLLRERHSFIDSQNRPYKLECHEGSDRPDWWPNLDLGT